MGVVSGCVFYTIQDSIGGCGASVTVEELITETPLKLKRVLNKLMVENGQKDKEIQKLQVVFIYNYSVQYLDGV